MSVEAVTKAGAFTDEILAKNFIAIGKEFNNVSQWQRHMEAHISELFEATSDLYDVASGLTRQMAKPKGMKTKHKVLIGVAIGLYLGRRSMTNEFNKRMAQVKNEAKEKFDKSVEALKQESSNVTGPSEPKPPKETEFRSSI